MRPYSSYTVPELSQMNVSAADLEEEKVDLELRLKRLNKERMSLETRIIGLKLAISEKKESSSRKSERERDVISEDNRQGELREKDKAFLARQKRIDALKGILGPEGADDEAEEDLFI